MELYRKYRPKTLKDVIGQRHAVAEVQALVDKKRIPHAMLFTGPSGTGKTTMARILQGHVNCSTQDFHEVDCGDVKGVENVREIKRAAQVPPLSGGSKVWVVDECFPSGTLVDSPTGRLPIESIVSGDVVYGLQGLGRVKRIFRNRVELDRIVRVNLSDGSHLITTLQHDLLTDSGWVPAGGLKKDDCVFRNICEPVGCETMPILQTGDLSSTETVLLEKLCAKTQEPKTGTWEGRKTDMSLLQNRFFGQMAQPEEMLFAVLRQENGYEESHIPREGAQPEGLEPDIGIGQAVLSDRAGKETSCQKLAKNEGTESRPFDFSSAQDQTIQTGQWHFRSLEVQQGWQRQRITNTAEDFGKFFGQRLGVRICGKDRRSEGWISYLLQSGRCSSESQNRNRGRWDFPQIERSYVARCKENEQIGILRVDSVEVYQPGRNDTNFLSAVSDKDRGEGFATFYDLEIDGHPSYFASGLAVHNCHKMTNDAQNAFLKTLEDAPNHAYFFLCTTDPQKLIKTIRTRCTEINLEPINDEDLEDLVWDVVDQEKIDVSDEVVDEIVLISKGCARKALVLLDQVYSLKTEEEQIKAVRKGVVADEEAEKLSQMLLFPFKSSWSDVAKSLRSIEGSESESVRYMVLGYARACLLGKVGQAPNPKIAPRAFMILEVFADNTFDDKHAGLARMCWEAFNAKV